MSIVINGAPASPFQAVIDEIIGQLRKDYAPPRVKRDAHPKMHGCVLAEFIVSDRLPPKFQGGVFAVPGKKYRAWVRFSNAFKIQHDLEIETRGIAIKLLDVQGAPLEKENPIDADFHERRQTCSQDFLLATHDAFFLPDGKNYLAFAEAARTPGSAIPMFFIKRLRHGWARRGLSALWKSMAQLVWNPLAVTYFSQTPVECGAGMIVKLQARPITRDFELRFVPRLWFLLKVLVGNIALIIFEILHRGKEAAEEFFNKYLAPRDLLRHAMMTSLASHDAWFEVRAQPFIDEATTPIGDATRRWRESVSPFETVAVLHIPRQVFWPEPGMPQALTDATVRMVDLGENMAFNPWHGLEAHRPLGPINGVRRDVYRAVSAFRRDQNRVSATGTINEQVDAYDNLQRVVQHGQVQFRQDEVQIKEGEVQTT